MRALNRFDVAHVIACSKRPAVKTVLNDYDAAYFVSTFCETKCFCFVYGEELCGGLQFLHRGDLIRQNIEAKIDIANAMAIAGAASGT